jgi:hypothetical protein
MTVAAFLGLGFVVASGQQAQPRTRGLLSVLHVGQEVIARSGTQYGGLWQISVHENGPPKSDAENATCKVTEIGSDYLVVQDEAIPMEIRIPIHSITSIITLQAKRTR